MASFVPRKGPNGRRVWQAHIRRRGYPAQVRTFDNKTDAENWASDIEAEMRRGKFVSRAEAEGTTLAEALARYIDEVVLRKHTKGEDAICRWWSALPVSSRPMAAVRGKDITAAIRQKEAEGAGPRTLSAYLSTLSHLFTIARREWGMESLGNPAEFVRKPVPPQGRTRRLQDGKEVRLAVHAISRRVSRPLAGIVVGTRRSGRCEVHGRLGITGLLLRLCAAGRDGFQSCQKRVQVLHLQHREGCCSPPPHRQEQGTSETNESPWGRHYSPVDNIVYNRGTN